MFKGLQKDGFLEQACLVTMQNTWPILLCHCAVCFTVCISTSTKSGYAMRSKIKSLANSSLNVLILFVLSFTTLAVADPRGGGNRLGF